MEGVRKRRVLVVISLILGEANVRLFKIEFTAISVNDLTLHICTLFEKFLMLQSVSLILCLERVP